ncbi:MAG: hypothetical protein ACOCZ5_02835 [bacterium]
MSIKNMEVAKIVLGIAPNLVKSEESVNQLVMKDVIDFDTGMRLTENIRSNESEDYTPKTMDKVSNVQFPSVDEGVIAKMVLELSSKDEKEAFEKKIDELNLMFQSAYKKRKKEIERVISTVVEINDSDKGEAVKLNNIIRNEQMILIKK